MSVQGVSTEESEKEGKVAAAHVYALERNDRALEDLVARLTIEPEVTGISWERDSG